MTDPREEREQAVLAAAREERTAHTALVKGIRPQHPNWSEDDEEGYQARLTRWRAASHALADALHRLGEAVESPRRKTGSAA